MCPLTKTQKIWGIECDRWFRTIRVNVAFFNGGTVEEENFLNN